MFAFFKPSDARVDRFRRRQEGFTFSYPHTGASNVGSPDGYDLDHNRIQLGTGGRVFDAGRDALRRWQMFPRAWTEIRPANDDIQPGTSVVLLARVFKLWWMNACRIVYVIDEPRRFGFAYGTLPGHVESGEERFLVEWLADDSVWYDIRAFSRPWYWLVRLFYPLARQQQQRFVRDSQQAMREAVNNPVT